MLQASFFIFGSGGHAKVVLDTLLTAGYSDIRLFDDNPARLHLQVLGYPVSGLRSALIHQARLQEKAHVIVAVGHNTQRQSIYEDLLAQNIAFGQAIHPQSYIARSVKLGQGVMIMAQATLHPEAEIGDNAIVNTAAVIEHDCVVGPHSHIAPHATLCGSASIGQTTLIGAGAVVLPGIKVGQGCIIGAGAVVTEDVPDHQVVTGVPARIREKI